MPKGLKRSGVGARIKQELADDVGVIISKGNDKLDKIANVSIIPGDDCPGQLDECRWCYAKGAMQYSNWTKVRWTVNSFYAHNQLARFKMDVAAQIYLLGKHKGKYFRIHVGGDFFDQKYLEAWFWICRDRPETRFLAFTKSFDLDYSKKPDNLMLISSVFPSTDFDSVPDGPRAYTEFDQLKRFYPAHQNERLARAMRCTGTCQSCGVCYHVDENRVDVKFHAHGSCVKFVGMPRGAGGRFISVEGVI